MRCFHFKLKLTNWIFPVCSTTLIFCFHRVKGIKISMSAWGTALVSGVNRHPLTEQLEGTSVFIVLHDIHFFTMLCCGTFTLRRYFLTCAILSSGGCLHQRENRLMVTVKNRGRGMFHWRPWWRLWSRWRTLKPLRDVFCPRTAAVLPVGLKMLLNKTAFEVGINLSEWFSRVSKCQVFCFW